MMSDSNALPTFIIIGAMKCGTSSLHEYLAAHPDFSMSSNKEPDFFLEKKNWSRGFDWYRSLFDPSKPHRGESSVNYTKFPHFPDAPARIAGHLPDVRLVFVARDPIDRIRSHHAHLVSAMSAPRDLVLKRHVKKLDYYVACSRYAMQLSRFLEYFPRDRFHIVCSTELRQQTASAVHQVISFLGGDPSKLPHGACDARYHESGEKTFPTSFGRLVARLPHGRRVVRSRWLGPLAFAFRAEAHAIVFSRDIENYLQDQLAEDAEQFRAISGRPFPNWSV